MTPGRDEATAQVKVSARDVLDFWFGLAPEQHFAKSPALDAEIVARFGSLRDAVLASGAAEWRGERETLLAAIILLDQFSRNMHRGSGEAFAADPLAQALACEAIDRGWDVAMSPEQRRFLYMPLMHAESEPLQALSVAKFRELGDAYSLDFARQHAEVIARFGRFPTRNAALGRENTEGEAAYLSQPGVGW